MTTTQAELPCAVGKSPSDSWHYKLLKRLGPALNGVTLGDWLRLLAANGFNIPPRFWYRALATTSQSAFNSLLAAWERHYYLPRVESIEVRQPIFILGHWRSGTTHLHNLLSQDDRFSFPNLFQSLNPLTFLTSERILSRLLRFLVPRTRPFDNIALDFTQPCEDDFALWQASEYSSYMTWSFFKNRGRYDRYLTLRDVSEHEREHWKATLLIFLKKVTWKCKKPLILKSPQHTARIRVLLKMFPDAKFVHIHRNPYEVFPSTVHLNATMARDVGFQKSALDALKERVIQQYVEMYDSFFQEKQTIQEKRFCEVAYEDLEQNPEETLRYVYEQIELGDFEIVRSNIHAYLGSIGQYTKNEYPALPEATKKRIRTEWKRNFEAWGYQL